MNQQQTNIVDPNSYSNKMKKDNPTDNQMENQRILNIRSPIFIPRPEALKKSQTEQLEHLSSVQHNDILEEPNNFSFKHYQELNNFEEEKKYLDSQKSDDREETKKSYEVSYEDKEQEEVVNRNSKILLTTKSRETRQIIHMESKIEKAAIPLRHDLAETDIEQAGLAEFLKIKLTSGEIDCPICYTDIRPDESIWSCKRCFGPYHLKCIKQWVESDSINQQEAKKQDKPLKFLTWSCPKCKYYYSEEMPVYKCFCGKAQNPEHDPYSIPHSCGDTCEKPRSASCVHPCNLQCHPGPCPPCNLLGKTKVCFCGKYKVQVKCSDSGNRQTCNAICEKNLDCRNHQCSLNCHEGSCPPCKQTEVRSCYCGKEEKAQKCGIKSFGCKRLCEKPLNCGNHKCMITCHEGPCKPCPYTPDKLITCPCINQVPLAALGIEKRKSCLDPVPSCGLFCGKVLACGHSCVTKCHLGDCPDCEVLIEQYCHCESSKRKIECHLAYDGSAEDRIFTCERVCKKLKSCGVHKCGMKCCIASKGYDPDGAHLCVKTCNKPLNCNKHNCDLFCHLGNCSPCSIIINQPLTCNCGAAVKNPPLRCGTLPPTCYLPCLRPRECGHSCPYDCHHGDCPPCDELVEKLCNCGKILAKNVKCSKEVICGKVCENLLECGHVCGEICHKQACNLQKGSYGCGKRCGKQRKCGHICEALCHPENPCHIAEKCKIEIRLVCNCGNREKYVTCEEFHVLETKTLKCDQSCSPNRPFRSLFSKDITKRAYYPSSLVQFAKSNIEFVLKIETFAEKFLKEGKKRTTYPLQSCNTSKRNMMQTLLQYHYKLNIKISTENYNSEAIITTTLQARIPNIKLSEYTKKIEMGEIIPDILPFEASLRFFNLSESDSIDELEKLLKNYEGHFYIEKLFEKNIVTHFWEKSYAELAAKSLKKSLSNFADVSVEENEKLKVENDNRNKISQVMISEKQEFSIKEQKGIGKENSTEDVTKESH